MVLWRQRIVELITSHTNGPIGMNQLPRIAVGTVQPDADPQVMLWALISALERSGFHVQAFSSQSRFELRDASVPITGDGRRHLDSWMMQPEVCAQLFFNATRFADIGLVEGPYDGPAGQRTSGGSLNTLCEWLDLPKLVVVNAGEAGSVPAARVAIRCGGNPVGQRGGRRRDCVDSRPGWKRSTAYPCSAALERIEQLRALAMNLPGHGNPTAELCQALGDELLAGLRLEQTAPDRAPFDVCSSGRRSVPFACVRASVEHRRRV